MFQSSREPLCTSVRAFPCEPLNADGQAYPVHIAHLGAEYHRPTPPDHYGMPTFTDASEISPMDRMQIGRWLGVDPRSSTFAEDTANALGIHDHKESPFPAVTLHRMLYPWAVHCTLVPAGAYAVRTGDVVRFVDRYPYASLVRRTNEDCWVSPRVSFPVLGYLTAISKIVAQPGGEMAALEMVSTTFTSIPLWAALRIVAYAGAREEKALWVTSYGHYLTVARRTYPPQPQRTP